MGGLQRDKSGQAKYLWLDLEMTGLEVERERVIEIAAVATDEKLKNLGQFHCAVNQPQSFIDGMDEWNQKHHRESGLIDLLPSGLSPDEAEKKLIDWTQSHFAEGEGDSRPILAGNSIAQDRKFIDAYFKNFEFHLHYRMLDVTAWKMVLEPLGFEFPKQEKHRAIDDILESIEELKFYLNKLKVSL